MKNRIVSKNTINMLEDLLSKAKDGEVIGIAYVGIRRGRRHFGGWSGYAYQDPLFALGAIQRLNLELASYSKKNLRSSRDNNGKANH